MGRLLALISAERPLGMSARWFLIAVSTALALKASAAEGFQGHSLGAFLGSFLSRNKNEQKYQYSALFLFYAYSLSRNKD